MSLQLRYTVDFSSADQHLFNLELHIPSHQHQQLTLSLPSWLPGSYMIRDFAKNIINLSATDQVEITAIDKQSWQVNTGGKACIIRYQVYALDHSVRTAFLDRQRAFFNGSSVFLAVVEMSDIEHLLEVKAPQFSNQWQVATGLPRANNTAKYHFGHYVAADYAQLIDCPFEVAPFDHVEFEVAGVCHHLILSGRHYGDLPRIASDLTKLCQHHIDLFERDIEQTPPFSEYWFLTNILPNGFGGLEHKNSTALLCSTFDFANKNSPIEVNDSYQSFLSLASHEYFHAWNICRIKPQEFIPYPLDQECYTQQLWAYEGITSYYDDFSLYRSGIISFEKYLSLLSKTISRVNRGQGQSKQSVIESSFYTWTKFYQQGADAQNNIVSYYTKGSLVALWLDLTIRERSHYQYSLDDVMRKLWQDFGKPNIGTKLNDIIDIASALIKQDLTQELLELLHGKTTIPLQKLLDNVGVALESQASKVQSPLIPSTCEHNPYLGISIKASDTGVVVTTVAQDSPAEQAGINAQDQLIAFDKLVLSSTNLATVVANLSLGQSFAVDFIRQGQLLTTELTLVESPQELSKLVVTKPDLTVRWQQH